ncbi:MAG: hypothetical protein VCD66_11070 [Alphaproteobacteria bacterium]
MGSADLGAYADIVHIWIEEGDAGLLYATSPELPGLLLAEPDRESLNREIPGVIKAMYKAQGVDVDVLPIRNQDDHWPWVAIPTHVVASEIVQN